MRLQRSSWQEIRRFCATAPASPSWAREKPRRRGLRAPASWPHGCERAIVVVSGLAAGIDTAAHHATLAAGGHIAVLGTPLDQVYPKTNMALQHQIMREHLCISQFPAGAPIHRKNFPMRNRTMALLSDATVIIEATDTSGSLAKGGKLCVSVGAISCKSVAEDATLAWPTKMLYYGGRVLSEETLDRLFDFLPTGQKRTCVVPFPSNLAFVSLLQYAPRGTTPCHRHRAP